MPTHSVESVRGPGRLVEVLVQVQRM
jgi:hypothetical protein